MSPMAFATAQRVEAFLQDALPGTEMVYARGPRLPAHIPATVDAIRDAYDAGEIELAQRRVAEGFAYIAQKRRRIGRVSDWGRFSSRHAH